MFKRLFSLSNPLGVAFTAAALVFALSPEARRGTRKLLVKGAAALLSVGDQVKSLTVGARKEIGHIVEEAKIEKEQNMLPDFSDMIKSAGDSAKEKITQGFDSLKTNVEKAAEGIAHTMEMGGEITDTLNFTRKNEENSQAAQKRSKNSTVKKTKDSQNVLSNNSYHSVMGKPPFQ